MEIKNFSGNWIRIGSDYPNTVDIISLPDSHSGVGLIINIPTYHDRQRGSLEEHFFQIRRRNDTTIPVVLIRYRWLSQLEKLPDWIGDVLFDSRSVKKREDEQKDKT